MIKPESLTLSPASAAEVLKKAGLPISAEKIRFGLRQRVYSFGDAVEMCSGEYSYAVYAVLLEQWIKERTGGV